MESFSNPFVSISFFLIFTLNNCVRADTEGIFVTSDEIFLNDGEKVSTEILDTNGCSIKIRRHGNIISIRKNLLGKIVWKHDTIVYAGYVCKEKLKPIVRLQDTPEYRLWAIFDKPEELGQAFKENARLAFLYRPFQGNYNGEEFTGILIHLGELFKKKAKMEVLSPSEMLEAIESGKNNFDYAFFAKKYDVFINPVQKNYNNGNGILGINPQPKRLSDLTTTAEFVLFNISTKSVIYHKIMQEKRSVWGENDYTWIGALTPVEWKKEREKKQTDRKLDKNAQAIRDRMERDLAQYLGIDADQ